MSSFSIHNASLDDSEARAGRLKIPGRNPIDTPHYVAISSRGTVPHITQDMMGAETGIRGIYAGVEDYVEQLPKTPPACEIPCRPGESPLRRFIALRNDALLVLGPRRAPPLSPPTGNTYTSINISTSSGFRQLEVNEYISVSQRLRPDIIIGPLDYELGEGSTKPGRRRTEKMGERTMEWTRGLSMAKKRLETLNLQGPQIWPSVLPIASELQSSYLDYLEEEAETFSGLALYDIDLIASIPSALASLPRMTFADVRSPQALLRAIDLGADVMTLPFISKLTDAGVAFTFTFPISDDDGTGKRPLGLDVWSKDLATSLEPLFSGCTCYACRTHHRAYLRHLLDAKEMLAWTLLQIHNHHQIDAFFTGVRLSISQGTFSQHMKDFIQSYEDDFPAGSGEGPRLRGYQIRISTAGPAKANRPARRKLETADLEAIDAARAAKAKEKGDRIVDHDAQKMGEAMESGLFAAEFDCETEVLER